LKGFLLSTPETARYFDASLLGEKNKVESQVTFGGKPLDNARHRKLTSFPGIRRCQTLTLDVVPILGRHLCVAAAAFGFLQKLFYASLVHAVLFEERFELASLLLSNKSLSGDSLKKRYSYRLNFVPRS
jgi:hypothetical protein